MNGLEENAFQIMWQSTPLFAIFILAIITSGFIVYQVMKFYARFEKIETRVPDQEAQLAELKKWRHESDVRFVRIDAKLDMLVEKMDFLIRFFLDKNKSDR